MAQRGRTSDDRAQGVEQIGFDAPAFYANGFDNVARHADVTTVALWNDRPQAVQTMSLPLAKSYALALLDLVDAVGRETGQSVSTIQELEQARAETAPSGQP